jgi:hypothetical protein
MASAMTIRGARTPSPRRGKGVGGLQPPFLTWKNADASVGYGERVTILQLNRRAPSPGSLRDPTSPRSERLMLHDQLIIL